MRKLVILFLFFTVASFAQKSKPNPNKLVVVNSVEKHQQELISISDKIWAYAETALKEYKSSKKGTDLKTDNASSD